MANAYCQLLPWSADNGTPIVLIGQRNLVQTWADGKEANPKLIPDWAGQWTTIGGFSKNDETPDNAAFRLFYEQTGINLIDTNIAKNYSVQAQTLVQLQDRDYTTIYILYLSLPQTGLAALCKDAEANINKRALRNGLLLKPDTPRKPEAESRLGPLAPPPDGWANYLVQNYFGGKAPGQLNTGIDALTKEISAKTQMPDAWFRLALDNIPSVEEGGSEDDIMKLAGELLVKAEPAPPEMVAEMQEMSGAKAPDLSSNM